MDAIRTFLLDLNDTPDHSIADIEQEIKALSLHERMVTGFLKGEVDLDVVDDHLAQIGVNPHEYWDLVNDVVDQVVSGKRQIDPGYSTLLL